MEDSPSRAFVIAVLAAGLAMTGVATAQTVRGTRGNDTLYGTPKADAIYGYAGEDFLYGGRGNDHLDGGAGQDHIKGGPGNDTIFGGRGQGLSGADPHGHHEYIRGNEGDDVIVLRAGGTVVWAGPGDDRIDMRDPRDRCRPPFGGVLRAGTGTDGGSRHASAAKPLRELDPPHCSQLLNTGTGANVVRADDGNFDDIDCFGRRDRVVIDQYDYAPACKFVKRVRR
jgi:Ca2+-binding RTX toxin-like protein